MALVTNNRTAALLSVILAVILIIIAIASTVFMSVNVIRIAALCIVAIIILIYGVMSYLGKV